MKHLHHVIACVLSLTLVCGVSVTFIGCSNKVAANVNPLAATVNGVSVPESEVDTYITAFRQGNLDTQSDVGWQDWLDSAGYTQEGFRLQVIDSLIDDTLIRESADDNGITVDEDQVDDQIARAKSNYGSETAWRSALEANGYTEDDYRDSAEISYLTDQLKEQVVKEPTPTAAEFRDYANSDASRYDGRRSSQILFSTADLATAQDVLAQLQEGADFATMARKYSIDTISAAEGGDVGWDSLNYFSGSYQRALNALDPGELSGVVQTDYGYTIILCTDMYETVHTATGVDLSAIPADIKDAMENDLMTSMWSDAFDSYLDGLRSDASIVIFNEDGSVYTESDGDNSLVGQSASDTYVDGTDNTYNLGVGADASESIINV